LKKLLIIIVILSLITIIGTAKLSDETLKTVEELRWKHYNDVIDLNCIGVYSEVSNNIEWIEWNRDFLSIWVEDGKLFVETQDGKWFIEMEKIE
jgi:hypothetical protein